MLNNEYPKIVHQSDFTLQRMADLLYANSTCLSTTTRIAPLCGSQLRGAPMCGSVECHLVHSRPKRHGFESRFYC